MQVSEPEFGKVENWEQHLDIDEKWRYFTEIITKNVEEVFDVNVIDIYRKK